MIKFILPLFLLFACVPKSGSNKQIIQSDALSIPDHTTELSNRFITDSNYLTLSDVREKNSNQTTAIEFDIHWGASWRNGNTFDAVWIFIKAKSNDGLWQHVRLKSNEVRIASRIPSTETNGIISVAPDGVGFVVHRQFDSQGDNDWTVFIQLDQDVDYQGIEYKAFGLEMVHVAEGPYELGTLKGIRDRREVLTQGAGGAPYNPFFTYKENARDNYGGVYKISDEDPIDIDRQDGDLFWIDANIPGTNTFSGVPEGRLSAEFPKGAQGFYQMKYELSQQEYCDFLNTLTPRQQSARDITSVKEFDRHIGDYRNEISKSNGIYTTSRPNRPCNFLSWLDGQAFADWAGLRHMTELEFEKSCRGPNVAVYREYVWGVNEIKEPTHMQYVNGFYKDKQLTNEELGDEVTDGNIHASMFSYKNYIDVCTTAGNFYDPSSVGCRTFKGGDGGRGPVRKGIFGVTSNGSRIKAGASYFGAMELGGNLQEPVVTVGHPSGRKFMGTHGNGTLTEDGFADNEDWQPVNEEYAFGGRGGCWKFHENHARTADRFKGLRQNEKRRASHIGFRGVRTSW